MSCATSSSQHEAESSTPSASHINDGSPTGFNNDGDRQQHRVPSGNRSSVTSTFRPGGPQRVHETIEVSTNDGTHTSMNNVDGVPESSVIPDEDSSTNETSSPDTSSSGVPQQRHHDDTMQQPSFDPNANPAFDNDDVDETERLLDTISIQPSTSASTNNSTDPANPFGRRTLRARTLSGKPLSVPLNCSPAVLRHGLGTALSTNNGDVVPSTTTTAAGPSGAFEEIGKRKNIKWDPALLIEGVLFRANYLGSTQLVCDGQPTKTSRMMQAEEAVARIKAPAGEHQPSCEVDLCISTMTIMVLNAGSQDIIMDPPLRTISYIADIGDLVVLMAKRPLARRSSTADATNDGKQSPPPPSLPPPKILCHVFESGEALLIAQTIGQAFHVAYSEFLRANGLSSADDDRLADADRDPTLDVDYQAVLSSQQLLTGDELELLTHKERQKEITVGKSSGEPLGVALVESGWGSLLPTCVVANLAPSGAAARSGEINIGDQLMAVDGCSLVGLPLAECEAVIAKRVKGRSSVQLTLVACAPVVEVLVRRPTTKYPLGFSVQLGVVCSLLRGGIAERGGVRVGHRIIEINEQSVVALAHEKIVAILASAVGEIRMKTMPTTMFRLLTGQENPTFI